MGLMTKFKNKKYYNKVNYTVLNQDALSKKTDVTVVVPVYNAIDF